MNEQSTTLPTVGVIARRAGCEVHRIVYLIKARGIRPCGRAGSARVFSDADADRIVAASRAIDQGRGRAVAS